MRSWASIAISWALAACPAALAADPAPLELPSDKPVLIVVHPAYEPEADIDGKARNEVNGGRICGFRRRVYPPLLRTVKGGRFLLGVQANVNRG